MLIERSPCSTMTAQYSRLVLRVAEMRPRADGGPKVRCADGRTRLRFGSHSPGRTHMRLRAVMIAAALLATSNMALAQKPEDLSETIDLFKSIPQVAPYFTSSYGYAVWPRIGRGGLGIGGARGKGQVYQGGNATGISTLTDVTIGAQAGGQAYRQVIFFKDKA